MNMGSLNLVDSTVRINGTFSGKRQTAGGGIEANGTATSIVRSTLNANTSDYGGGLDQIYGALEVVNSTIAQNVANQDGGGFHLDYLTSAKFNNVTDVSNSAPNAYPFDDALLAIDTVVTLSNSILGDNVCIGTASLSSNGYNVIGGDCPVAGSAQFPKPFISVVDGLAFNGGTTATQAFDSASQAFDAGDPDGCLDPLGAPLATDQRGVKRKIGAACDLGAFELEPIGDANGDGTVDVSDVFYLINFLFAGGDVPHGRANVDGVYGIDVNDVFYLVNFLFAGGTPPK